METLNSIQSDVQGEDVEMLDGSFVRSVFNQGINQGSLLDNFNKVKQNLKLLANFAIISITDVVVQDDKLHHPWFIATLVMVSTRPDIGTVKFVNGGPSKKSALAFAFLKCLNLLMTKENIQERIHMDQLRKEQKQMNREIYNSFNVLRHSPKLMKERGLTHVFSLSSELSVQLFNITLHYADKFDQHFIKTSHKYKQEAEIEAINELFMRYPVPMQAANAQMDGEEAATEVGVVQAEETKDSETSVMVDAAQSKVAIAAPPVRPLLLKAASSALTHKFDLITQRWVIVKQFKLVADTPSTDYPWQTVSLPADILKTQRNNPNALPAKNFKFLRPTYTVKVKVNSNRFNQGRLLVSYLPQAENMKVGTLSTIAEARESYRSIKQAVMRDHAFIDLNSANEVELEIPFLNTYSLVPVYDKADQISNNNVNLDLHIMSLLKTPNAAAKYVHVIVMVKFNSAEYTAMQPAVEICPPPPPAHAQMDILGGILGTVAEPLIGAATGLLGDLVSPVLGILSPKRKDGGETEFDNKGVKSLLNMDKPASHKQPMEFRPNVVGDLAVAVKTEPKLSMRLDSTVLTPHTVEHFNLKNPTSTHDIMRIWQYMTSFTWSMADQTVGAHIFSMPINPGESLFEGTALHYFSQMYSYYSGTLELRFDIIGTQFHNGSLSISYLPYVTNFDEEQSRSGIWKYLDVQQTRQHMFNVPFISPTVLRLLKKEGTNIAVDSPGEVRVFIQNPQVPVATVTDSVEVQVFVRAGPDFHYTGLVNPACYILPATAQMDDGTKEEYDMSHNGNKLEHHGVQLNIGEDHQMITDVMKRWYQIDTFDITDKHDIQLRRPFKRTLKAVPADMISSCFRYVRGGQCLLLTFQVTAPAMKSKRSVRADPVIIEMTPSTVTPPTHLPTPTTMQAPIPTSYTPISYTDLEILANTTNKYETDDLPWKADTEFVQVAQAPGNYQPFNNKDFNIQTYDQFEDIRARSQTNMETDKNNLQHVADGIGKVETYTDLIKSSMDHNVGVNSFLTQNEVAVNQLINNQTSLEGTYNTNFVNTNANNAAIVAAIESGGGRVEASVGARIKVSYKPFSAETVMDATPFAGVPTQMVFTEINPTIKLYIPYYSIFNYNDWLNTSTKALDALTSTLGILHIETDKPVKCEAYWSAADDFGVHKFIGIPDYAFTPPAKVANAQMDPIPSTSDGTVGDFTANIEGLHIRSKFSNFRPEIADKGYSFFHSASQTLKRPFIRAKKMYEAVDKVTNIVDKADEIMQKMQATVKNVIDYLTEKFSWFTHTGPVFNALLHLLQVFIHPSRTTVVIAIAGVLTSIGLLSVNAVTSLIDWMRSNIPNHAPEEQHLGAATQQCDHNCSSCRGPQCKPLCGNCEPQRNLFDVNACATLGGLIMGLVSGAVGISSLPDGIGLCKGLFKIIPTFWTSITHSVRFLRDLITLIVRAFKRIGRADPVMAEVLELTENREQIELFVTEAQYMLDQRNRTVMLTDFNFKKRFWYNVAMAYTLQRRLIMCSQPESRNLLNLCCKVIDLANELSVQAECCPIRYEPWVIGLIGPSAVGKSFLMQSLLPELLNDKDGIAWTGYQAPIYTRTAGVEYWNGYTNQPAILYDDFLASTDPTIAASQIIEMYNLKSPAIMNCNMADLNEKKLTANPFIVAMCMNKMIVPTGITEPEAFLRRKDCLWNVRIRPIDGKVKTVRGDYTEEQQQNYDHLEFQRLPDVTTVISKCPWIGYGEFLSENINLVRKYHLQEQKNVRTRFENLKRTLPEAAQTVADVTDPFAVFYEAYHKAVDRSPVQTGFLPSEIIAGQVHIAARFQQAANVPAPQMDWRIMWGKMKRIAHWPQHLKDKMLSYMQGYRAETVLSGQCYACLEDGLEFAAHCAASNTHGICLRCHNRLNSFSAEPLRCGVCRHHHMIVDIIGPATWREMCVAPFRSFRGIVDSFVTSRWFAYGMTVFMMYFITFTGSFLEANRQRNEDMTWSKIFEIDCVGKIINGPLGLFYYSANGQMENSDIVEQLYNNVTCKIRNPRSVTFRNLHTPASGECPHKILLAAGLTDISYYHNLDTQEVGEWLILHYKIPDVKCDLEECRFTQLTRMNFVQSWIQARQSLCDIHFQHFEERKGRIILFPSDCIDKRYFERHSEEQESLRLVLEQNRSRTMWERLTGVWEKYGKIIKIAIAGMSFLATLIGGVMWIKDLMYSQAEPQIGASGDLVTLKPSRVTAPQVLRASQQGCEDMVELAINRCLKNTIYLDLNVLAKDGKKMNITCRGLGLYGRSVLFTGHEIKTILYWQQRNKEGLCENFSCKLRPFLPVGLSTIEELTKDFEVDASSAKFFERNDICVIQISKTHPQFKNIISYMTTEKQHTAQFMQCELIESSKQRINAVKQMIVPVRRRHTMVPTLDSEYATGMDNWNVYEIEYSKQGACGSLSFVQCANPLFGFHVSGYNGQNVGFHVPLIQEDFRALEKNELLYDVWTPALAADQQCKINLTGSIWKVGCVSKIETPYVGDDTKIVPSKLVGRIEGYMKPQTFPSILSSKDDRYEHLGSPLKHGCMKHTKPPKELPKHLLKIATQHISERFIQYCKPMREIVGPLSIEEAIVGFDGKMYYDPIKLNTSAGWPYNTGSAKSKADFIEVVRNEHSEVKEVKIHQKILDDMAVKSEMRRRKIRPFTVFQDTLKDERRKESKLKLEDGTRVFSQSPVDFTIQSRQYNLDFAAAMMNCRKDLSHGVGLTTNSSEWSMMANRMRSVGSKILAGDFKDYGPRMWASVVRSCGKIINDWYSHYSNDPNIEESNLQRSIMIEEIANCYHLCTNLIYMVFCGIPSGHPLTTIINTMCQILIFCVCWLDIMKATKFAGLANFWKFVVLFVYGDDGVASLDDEIAELFNCLTIGEFLADFNFVYTDAGKMGNIPYQSLEEVSFLKCGFKPHPNRMGQWLAPLEEMSIHECALWIFQCADLRSATLQNAEQSIRLAFGHGPEFYEDWRRRVNDALESIYLPRINLNWYELDELFFYDQPWIYVGEKKTYVPSRRIEEKERNCNNISQREEDGTLYKVYRLPNKRETDYLV